jgi:hypothetical protein
LSFDFLFKITLMGEDEEIINEMIPRLRDDWRGMGLRFAIEDVDLNGTRIKLQVWNVFLNKPHLVQCSAYLRGSSAAIITSSQFQATNMIELAREHFSVCGPSPINFIIQCTSPFAENLVNSIQNLASFGNVLQVFELKNVQELYSRIASDLVQQNGLRINLFLRINNSLPWAFFDPVQDNLVSNFVQILNRALSIWMSWTPPQQPTSWTRPHQTSTRWYELFKNGFFQYNPEFIEAIESMGMNIDREQKSITILNKSGEFKINLVHGDVHFLPIECVYCEENCPREFRSLCIVSDTRGWSNSCLSGNQLLILAKIYAINHQIFPEHVWNQILQKSTCPRDKKKNKAPTFTGLRDEMLRELRRLKNIMRGG